MRPARLARRAARMVGIDADALPHRSRSVLLTPSRLGIILIIAGLNTAFWISAIALACAAAGIELSAALLAGLGGVIIVLSVVGLAITMVESR